VSNDLDKREWQAQQAARDALMDKEREKHRKARERSARNAQRKLERLRRQLGEAGEMSEWEDEFSESVSERLDKYGSAFADLQKGRPGDALSFAQKRVLAALNKKAKDKRKAARAKAVGASDAPDDKPKYGKPKKRSSFQSKNKKTFKPRVRQLDESFNEEIFNAVERKEIGEPFIPEYDSPNAPPRPSPTHSTPRTSLPQSPVAKRPFLRLVTSNPKPIKKIKKLG